MPRFDAVCFDLDGTLYVSDQDSVESLEHASERYDLALVTNGGEVTQTAKLDARPSRIRCRLTGWTRWRRSRRCCSGAATVPHSPGEYST